MAGSLPDGVYNAPPAGTPKAYLVWMLFDNEFNLVKSGNSTGVLQLPGEADQLHMMAQNTIVMDKGGFFFAYTVNESPVNVYFDDFKVTTHSGPVLEENHYYPFGILNEQLSCSGTTNPKNNYKYNGKELQKELFLEWLDYGAQFYDPVIGRWHVVDNKSELYSENTPYTYSANNPIRFIDPDGNSIWDQVNGVVRGTVDNVLGSNIRANYNPTNADEYNNALDQTDRTLLVAGTSMIVGGGYMIKGGIAAAPETEGVSLLVSFAGAGTTAAGSRVTYNAAKHLYEGNNYGGKDKSSFNGKQDTQSGSSKGALRNAKEQNGIPRSQQPDKTTSVQDKRTGKPLRQYEYTNSKGEKVQIRKDNPVVYPDGGKQGKHYNAGNAGKKLNQHHNH